MFIFLLCFTKIIYYCLNISFVVTQNFSVVSESPKPVVRIYIIVIFGDPRLKIKEDKTWNIVRLSYSKDLPSQNLIINIHLTRIRLPTIRGNKPIGRPTMLHEKIKMYTKLYKKEVAFIISDGISQDMALVASELKIPLIGCSQNVQIPTGLGITQPIWISPSKFQQYEALKSFIIKRGHSGCVVFLVLRDFKVAFYNILSETLDNNTIRLINNKTDLENLVKDETFQFRKVYIFLIVEPEYRKTKVWDFNEFLVESLLKVQHHRRNKAVVLMSSDIFDTIKIHGTRQLIDILSDSETYMVNTVDKMSPFELVSGCVQRSIKILSDTLVSSNIEISKRCQNVTNGCLSSRDFFTFKRSILQRYLLNHIQGNIQNTLQPMYIFGVYKFKKVFQYQDAQMRTRNWPEALMFKTFVQVKKIHLRIVTYLESPHVMIRNLSRKDECSSKIYGRICYLIDATMKLRKEYCCFGIAIDIVNDLASLNSYSENNKVSLIGISEVSLEIIVVDSASITDSQRRGWQPESGGHQSILISSINRSDADVAVGSQIVIAKINVNYALLTKPYLITQIGLLIYRRDRMTGIVAFLYPFHWSMWIGIFITIQVVSVATTVYEWLSPYGKTPRGRNQSRIFSFSSALTLCWSALFSHTFPTKSPKCWSSRFLMNIYACFCVIFLASYTAKLAAYMVGKNTIQNIIGIHDTKIQNGKLKLGTISGSGTDYHLRMTQYPLYKYLLLFQNSEDVLVALKEGRIDAFVYDFESLQFFKRIHFRENFETVGKPFGQLFYTVAFSKNLDSTGTELNDFMSKIISSDNFKVRMEQRIQLWTKEMTGIDHSKMWSSDRMKVQNFAGPLIMMLLGFSLSFCALVLECIVYKFCVPRFRKNNFSQSCLPISQRFNRLLFCDLYYSKSSWSERHKFMKQDGLIGERLINHRRLSETLNIDFKQTLNKILKSDYDKKNSEKNCRTFPMENILLNNTKKNPNFQDYKRQISDKESQTDSTIEEIQIKYIEELKRKISNLTTENLYLSNKLLKFNARIYDG